MWLDGFFDGVQKRWSSGTRRAVFWACAGLVVVSLVVFEQRLQRIGNRAWDAVASWFESTADARKPETAESTGTPVTPALSIGELLAGLGGLCAFLFWNGLVRADKRALVKERDDWRSKYDSEHDGRIVAERAYGKLFRDAEAMAQEAGSRQTSRDDDPSAEERFIKRRRNELHRILNTKLHYARQVVDERVVGDSIRLFSVWAAELEEALSDKVLTPEGWSMFRAAIDEIIKRTMSYDKVEFGRYYAALEELPVLIAHVKPEWYAADVAS